MPTQASDQIVSFHCLFIKEHFGAKLKSAIQVSTHVQSRAKSTAEEGSASKDSTYTTKVERQYCESCLSHRTGSPAALVSLSLSWLPCPSCFVESNIVGSQY